ncbi:peptide deformylase [Xenococcus sp. PCC 7305]|uniref:peptide deformylase n=1 Tax=Xenococcus sp. PCC 7305 TaxID=102125 RepID=UPI0002AC6D29|nr:peptide deformylase [Xenococcus sp. PCC 7305]ELS05004.1 peptide deformylase [Xenococcus sp. PCC 7305]
MTILKVAELGNPILRCQAKSIDMFSEPKIVKLIDDLISTAELNNGVGIAAPQVSESYRLFIVASRPNIRYPQAPKMSPTAIINPIITSYSSEIVKDWEGCLSVPGFRGLVPRDRAIEVEYTNIAGDRVRKIFTDFIARIFQHELDHLDGLVFLDRLESSEDLYTEAEYEKRMRDEG